MLGKIGYISVFRSDVAEQFKNHGKYNWNDTGGISRSSGWPE
jgi:hypothetical protein